MTVAFGSCFKDIFIQRHYAPHDDTGEVQKYILVPLSYGPKQKWIYRIKQNPVLEAGNVAIVMPRIAFTLDNMNYDAERKLQSTVYNTKTIDSTHKAKQYVPVPYNFEFSVYVLADNQEDGLAVLEQILVFFTPEFTLTVNTVPEMGISNDVPIVLNSITSEDNFDTDFEQKRMIIWTLQFTMKGWVYGPIKEQGIIRRTIIDEHVVGGGGHDLVITDEQIAKTPRHVRKTGTPDPITAGPDDNWDFKLDIEEFDDGKRRDPVDGIDKDIP